MITIPTQSCGLSMGRLDSLTVSCFETDKIRGSPVCILRFKITALYVATHLIVKGYLGSLYRRVEG
jgi:hypothetical protein